MRNLKCAIIMLGAYVANFRRDVSLKIHAARMHPSGVYKAIDPNMRVYRSILNFLSEES